MANLITQQRIIDSNKRALIKFVFKYVDTATESNTTILDVSTLNFSLNTNGYIMTGNTDSKSNYRTTLKRIYGNAHLPSSARIQWKSDANNDIVTFNSGGFDYNFESMGDGATIPQDGSTNINGDLVFSTAGTLAAGHCFTLFVDLRKDGRDFDSGQTADPYSFNKVN